MKKQESAILNFSCLYLSCWRYWQSKSFHKVWIVRMHFILPGVWKHIWCKFCKAPCMCYKVALPYAEESSRWQKNSSGVAELMFDQLNWWSSCGWWLSYGWWPFEDHQSSWDDDCPGIVTNLELEGWPSKHGDYPRDGYHPRNGGCLRVNRCPKNDRDGGSCGLNPLYGSRSFIRCSYIKFGTNRQTDRQTDRQSCSTTKNQQNQKTTTTTNLTH